MAYTTVATNCTKTGTLVGTLQIVLFYLLFFFNNFERRLKKTQKSHYLSNFKMFPFYWICYITTTKGTWCRWFLLISNCR